MPAAARSASLTLTALALLAAPLAAPALAGAWGGLPTAAPVGPGGPGAADASVTIQNFAFSPNTTHVNVGESVTWTNSDLVTHTSSSTDGTTWDSGNLANGASFAFTFHAAGTFGYQCNIHHSMKGTVVVVDPAASADLVVTALSFADPVPGLQKTVTATIKNQGANTAGASKALLAYKYHGALHTIAEVAVPELTPFASTTAGATWDTTLKVGDFTVAAIADSEHQVKEANEANNELDATTTVLLPVAGVPSVDLLDPVG